MHYRLTYRLYGSDDQFVLRGLPGASAEDVRRAYSDLWARDITVVPDRTISIYRDGVWLAAEDWNPGEIVRPAGVDYDEHAYRAIERAIAGGAKSLLLGSHLYMWEFSPSMEV